MSEYSDKANSDRQNLWAAQLIVQLIKWYTYYNCRADLLTFTPDQIRASNNRHPTIRHRTHQTLILECFLKLMSAIKTN